MNKKAFTLAEVLITLGIIGIVAALTLPSLIQKQNEKAQVTALKKFYSNISQAYALVIKDNGTPDIWKYGSSGKENSKIIFEKFKPYLKKIKVCEYEQPDTCFNKNIVYKNMDGSNYVSNTNPFVNYETFILADGSLVFFEFLSANCTKAYGSVNDMCFAAFVDLNGDKNPNILGHDFHSFRFTSKGVVLPTGVEKFDDSVLGFDEGCGSDKLGYGCTAWMLYNENQDYLRCKDKLGWDKKTSCK